MVRRKTEKTTPGLLTILEKNNTISLSDIIAIAHN
jgi:hypothetical protein